MEEPIIMWDMWSKNHGPKMEEGGISRTEWWRTVAHIHALDFEIQTLNNKLNYLFRLHRTELEEYENGLEKGEWS